MSWMDDGGFEMKVHHAGNRDLVRMSIRTVLNHFDILLSKGDVQRIRRKCNRILKELEQKKMTRTITANVKSRKIVNDQVAIDWDDDKYGEPTEENVLKALEDLQVDFADVIDTDDSIEEYLSVSNIEEDED